MPHKESAKILANDLSVELRKSFSHKLCLAPRLMKPNCSGTIVAAHSLQRNGCGLNAIADQGHVLTPKPNREGSADMVKIGVGKASTFTEFCAFHNPRIFAPLETSRLIPTPEQIFFQTYRAFCFELFSKIAAHDHAQKLRERDLLGRRHVEAYSMGTVLGLRGLNDYKLVFDTMLTTSNIEKLRFVVYHLDRPPPPQCTAWLSINYGFQGQILQNISDVTTTLHGTMFSILPAVDGGFAIFAWINDHPVATRLKRSLTKIPIDELPEHLLHFAFEYAGNVFCKPSWWESLTLTQQDSLSRHFLSGTMRAPRSRAWLVLQPRIALDWRVTKITSV